MSARPSVAQLRATCAAVGIDATGEYDAVHARLGSHLVDRLYGLEPGDDDVANIEALAVVL